MLYANATFENYFLDGAASPGVPPTGPCEVRMDGGDIIVGGEFDREKWMYKGKEEGSGHYRLERRDPGIEGTTTLHRFEGADVLDGWWKERIEVDGKQLTLVGMWRIHLGKPDDV